MVDPQPLPDFSPWLKWAKGILALPVFDLHGVYLLARFENLPPQGIAYPLAEEVFYIGIAHMDTMARRLSDHEVWDCYKKHFPGEDDSKVYVAVYPPTSDGPVKVDDSHLKWLEPQCVKRYQRLRGRYPTCNKISPPAL